MQRNMKARFVVIAYAAESHMPRYSRNICFPGTRKVPESFYIQADHSVGMEWSGAGSQDGALIGEENVRSRGVERMRRNPTHCCWWI